MWQWFRRQRDAARRLPAKGGKRGFRRRAFFIEPLEERRLLAADAAPAEFILPPSEHLFDRNGGFLSEPSDLAPWDIALDFLDREIAEFENGDDAAANYAVSTHYVSGHTGVTHLRLQQIYRGLEIAGATININIAADGSVLNAGSSFVATPWPADDSFAGYAIDTGVATVSLDAERALFSFARKMGLADAGSWPRGQPLNAALFSNDEIPVALHYVPQPDGGLELAWNFEVRTRDGRHWYDASVSVSTAELLRLDDWASPANQYNVVPFPHANPEDAAREIVSDPPAADPVASPFGWHDTNGIAGNDTTTTTGNNADVFADRDDNDQPDPGSRPSGTLSNGDLLFDFPVDFNDEPVSYQDAAIVNAFYWTNIIHDILYQYGFDEAAGNFQEVNYTGVGGSGDAVEVHVQDGADSGNLDNANFFTPPDGRPGIMQLFEFSALFPAAVVVTSPADLGGTFSANTAAFGSPLAGNGISGDVVISRPVDGCAPLANSADINGHIALIARGDCFFVDKANAAQAAGAIGVIITNNVAGVPPGMAGDDPGITIPVVHISMADGDAVRTALGAGDTVSVDLRTAPRRDAAFDHEIIIHEYVHGLTNRLSANLNADQSNSMGEGWSDWYGLMLTQTAADSQFDAYPFGAYSTGDSRAGIREFPYSFDMSVNPLTFGDAKDRLVPHGVGEIWAATLWDLNWLLINGDGGLIPAKGFDADIYNAAGGSGNQIALQLVTDALKLQPANPTFVQARDAILAADTILTGGENHLAIWTAFARRGLGDGASAPSANSLDVVESFAVPDLPAIVAATKTVSLVGDLDRDGVADPGDRLRYEVAVTSANAAALNVTVQDSIDANTTLVADSVVTSQGTIVSGNAATDTQVVVNAGMVATGTGAALIVTYDVAVNESIPGDALQISNQATVSGGNFSALTTDDPDVAGDNDPTVIAVPQTDLEIDIAAAPNPAVPGQTLAFTITATNLGSRDVFAAAISDVFPASQLADISWTCSASPGSQCSPSGTGDISDSADLLAGGSVTYFVTSTVTIGAADELIVNSVSIQSPPAVRDFSASNNQATVALFNLLDFGDAPESYSTKRPGGARHVPIGPRLGSARDGETDGRPSDDATGDDADGMGPSDEDGIAITGPLLPGRTATLDVDVQVEPGLLNAWFDFNGDGIFASGEQVFADVSLEVGSHSLTIDVPATATLGGTIARFRIDRGGGLSFDGFASDGEVEDYQVTVAAPDLQAAIANDAAGMVTLGESWNWTATISNHGAGDAIFENGQVIFRDDLPVSGISYGHVTVANRVDVGGSGTIDCAIENEQLQCRAGGGDVSMAAGTGWFEVTIADVTPRAAGVFDNPRSPGSAAADPDGLLVESEETNNSASDSVAVSPATPTLTISLHEPNPSLVGESYSVQVAVSGVPGIDPTGTVEIDDGTGAACSITLSDGSGVCELTSTSAGNRTLAAAYSGDANYRTANAEAVHGIERAATTIGINDGDAPSRRGEWITVGFSVSVDLPGGGVPTGDIVVSDGVDSCTASVAAGSCSLALSTSGMRGLTARYAGDGNFAASESEPEPHFVGLVLDGGPLLIGVNELTAATVVAGETIHFAFGTELGSHELSELGITLGIASPTVFAVATVELDGAVTAEFDLPRSLSGDTLYFQAYSESPAADLSKIVSLAVPLLAADGIGSAGPPALQQNQLDTIAAIAIDRWKSTGVLRPEQELALDAMVFEIVAGEADWLADTLAATVRVDADAAGHGWFIDATPATDEEFPTFIADAQIVADDGAAAMHIDLLTVLMHQLGHSLGLPDQLATLPPYHLMADRLPVGTRRLPLNHTNLRDADDVNDDGMVTPLDVLWVINAINQHGSQPVALDSTPTSTLTGRPLYFDTTADFEITTSDVLQVINRINASPVSSASRNGHAASSASGK